MNRKTIRRELDQLAKKVEKAWKKHEKAPDRGNEPFICPGVGVVGRCTDSSVYLADRLGGVVFGYTIDENPSAEVGDAEGGHDFVLVDARWLVDFWAKDTYQLPDFYDMENAKDAAQVRKRYGDPLKWERMSEENFAQNRKSLKNFR